MASIHRKNGHWYYAYTDGQGKRHFPSTGILHSPVGIDAADTKRKKRENRARAQMLAAQIERVAQGSKRLKVIRKRFAAIIGAARETDAEQSGVTVRTYFDDWVLDKLPNVSPSYGNQLKLCKKEFCTSLGNRADTEIVHIDEEDIEDYVDSLVERKLGGRSVNKRLAILTEMFGDGEDNAFVIVNPVNEEHYQQESPLERQAFSVAQTELILGATRIIDWHTVTLFGFYCGMRLGDGRSQTWDAVDFTGRIITWVPIKTRRRRGRKAKVIITPLHPVLQAHLLKVSQMRGESPDVTPNLANRPISTLSAEFIGLVRAAGIDPLEQTLPNGRKQCLLTHHSLRHEFATELKRAGAPEKEWTLLTGHSAKWHRWNGESISQVARIYNHVDVEDRRKWIDKLPALKLPGTTEPASVKSGTEIKPENQ